MRLQVAIYYECPKLVRKMEKDAEKGEYDFSWPIRSDKSQDYIGKILGRKVEDTESVMETWREAERKL